MNTEHTTAVVQRYLDALAGNQPAEPIVRALLDRSVRRLQALCRNLLYRQYRRLTLPPLNLEADELLSAVVERLLKAMRSQRPPTVRRFFAMVNQHIRWELNDLARRLDERPVALRIDEAAVPAPASDTSLATPIHRSLLDAIDHLPDEEREIFSLVRVQGLTHAEAAEVAEISTKTVQRRLNRALVLLWKELDHRAPAPEPEAGPAAGARSIVPTQLRWGLKEIPLMADRDAVQLRVEQLLEQILESGDSPEEACRACPELLPEIRSGLRRLRQLEQEVGELFPPSDFHDSQPAELLSPDQLPVIPGHEVLAVLGHGGMGIVFRARHLRLNRAVALKMILAGGFASPTQRQRFLREAEAIAAISHPNIVQVYNAGESEGRPWFTMELVEGGSLAGKINGTPQPVGQSAALVASIAQAIAVAHRRGIVHRDLKPSNILLTADGVPKVTDFGLARWASEAGETFSGSPLGTPSYMAPEQARGASREIGPATDVYALGAILYEMLTGRPPFRGETSAATVQQVLTEQVVPPSRLNKRVPRDLETICLTCLDKDPARRYRSADALAEDLSRFLNDEPILASPVGRIQRCIRWGRRRPAHAALLCVSILVTGILVIGGLELHAQRLARIRDVQSDLRDAQRLARSSAWAEASMALDRAQGHLGSKAPEDLRQQVNRARNEIERMRLGSELVQRVDVIQLTRLTWVEGRLNAGAERRFRNQKADRQYASALSAAGCGAAGSDAEAVASRLAAYGVVPQLVVALDDWRVCAADRRRRDWLAEVLRRLDPDPWRSHVRGPAVWEDEAALREITQSTPPAGQPVVFLVTLAERRAQVSKDASAFLNRVQQAHSSDFWANFAVGNMLLPDDPQDAISYYRSAIAARPESLPALNNLGNAQTAAYVIPDATQTFLELLQHRPSYGPALDNFGFMWKVAGDFPQAQRYLRNAVNVDPDSAESRVNLAEIVAVEGGPGVVGLLNRAIAIDPKFARAHYLLGFALCARTPSDEANAILASRDPTYWGPMIDDPIGYYLAAIALGPGWAPVTQDRARLDDAIAEFRSAIECDPLFTPAYAGLAQALLNRGQAEAALDSARRGIEIQENPHALPIPDEQRDALARLRQRCQRAVELDARLSSMLKGAAAPASPAESLEFAQLCAARGLNGAAAAFYLRAFEAEKALAADQKAAHRYRAACAAALAGADGKSTDVPRWRAQSRQWLEAELDQYSSRLESGDKLDAIRTYFNLSHWLNDPALTSLRDDAALAKIPRQEADELRRLWADVIAIREQSQKIVNGSTIPPT